MALALPSRNALGVTVADVLRNEILSGSIKPGQPLHENALAKQLSVSRSPIREALSQLERESLVVSRLNRPAVVRKPSPEEIVQIYTLRAALEGIAARWAAEKSTHALVKDLERKADILNRATVAADRRTGPDVAGAAVDFHSSIAQAAGSPELERLLLSLRNQIRLVMASGLASLTRRRAEEVHAEHVALIAAIAAKDGDLAERLAGAHVRDARDRIVHLDEEAPGA